VAISASLNWIASKVAIGFPNWTVHGHKPAHLPRRPAYSAGLGADPDPAGIEAAEHLFEPLARLAEQVFRRDLGILEDQLRRSGGEDSHLFLDLADFKPRRLLKVDDQVDDPFVAESRIGRRRQDAVPATLPLVMNILAPLTM